MRIVKELCEGWKFCLTEYETTKMPTFDESCWQEVTVPHDWSIDTDFSPEHDPQPMESSILDYKENLIQIGRTGGLLVYGTGWYYKKIYFPDTYAHYFLEFDGIMSRGEVFVNGEKVAYRPYGYTSFSVDITEAIRKNAENEIIIRVNVPPRSSRWYPGAGLYRPVRLVMTELSYVPYHGLWIDSKYDVSLRKAELVIKCEQKGNGILKHQVFDPTGVLIGSCYGETSNFYLNDVHPWSTENPELYTLMTEIIGDEEEILDRVYTKFGIRSIKFDHEQGFILNGKQQKIKGVCLHHDLGMLGAAYDKDAVRYRLRHLKEMGCNAIRTTHNPPQSDTLDLCDEMGFFVIDEAFDEWHITKADNGYAVLFDEWAERDLTDMIRRDRNHPCIILYSIGNEVPDQVLPEGRETCRFLTEICHREDPSRLVTCGFNKPKAAIENGLTEEVDVVGLNYSNSEYERYHREHPSWKIIATETASCVSSRGEYFFPVELEMPVKKHEPYQVNSFDLSAPPFCCIPDMEFAAQKKFPFVAGEFVWSGYDYIGEPTPYRNEWPSRSSYFGIFDLAGIPKDRYWAYAAQWSTRNVLHILPHWTWERGMKIDVHCYSNLSIVRLFLNGRQIPTKMRYDHRIVFESLEFEPGILRAEGYRLMDGKEQLVCVDEVATAGKAYSIVLAVDNGGEPIRKGQVVYAEVHIVDENGNLCPNTNQEVTFSVDGGTYLAADNGDATSLRAFSSPKCPAFHGKLMLAVRTGNESYMQIQASANGLTSGKVIIEVQ